MDITSGSALTPGTRTGRWQKMAGFALAVVGVFWLAKRAGWLPTDHDHPALFWPMAVIAIGLLLYFGRNHGRDRHAK